MPKQTTRKPKKLALMQLVAQHLDAGTYFFATHGDDRKDERGVTQMEVEYVLRHGWWEKKKDSYNEQYDHPWSYAIRGNTVDGRELRIAIGFEVEPAGETMLVITVIDLDAD